MMTPDRRQCLKRVARSGKLHEAEVRILRPRKRLNLHRCPLCVEDHLPRSSSILKNYILHYTEQVVPGTNHSLRPAGIAARRRWRSGVAAVAKSVAAAPEVARWRVAAIGEFDQAARGMSRSRVDGKVRHSNHMQCRVPRSSLVVMAGRMRTYGVRR